MKYRELLKEGMEELKKAGTTDAQIDAEYLLEYVSGMNRASYLMCMMEQAPEDVIERYREFIKMRAAHESFAVYHRGTGIYGTVLCSFAGGFDSKTRH